MSRPSDHSIHVDLDALMQIKLPTVIRVQKQGISRPPSLRESLSMVLGSLGTLGRSSGVQAINTEIDGEPVALAVIAGARFGEDSNGNTTLREISIEPH